MPLISHVAWYSLSNAFVDVVWFTGVILYHNASFAAIDALFCVSHTISGVNFHSPITRGVMDLLL